MDLRASNYKKAKITTTFYLSLKEKKMQKMKELTQGEVMCGPTSLKCALMNIGLFNNLSPQEISDQCFSPQYGTRMTEMLSVLNLLKINYNSCSRGENESTINLPSNPIEYLKEETKNNYILLRTMVGKSPTKQNIPETAQGPGMTFQGYAGYKHWVVVYGFEKGNFLVMDPMCGNTKWSVDKLEFAWKARGYDHFSLPKSRDMHPDAIQMEKVIDLVKEEETEENFFIPNDKEIYEKTVDEFTTNVPIIEEFKPMHHAMIDQTKKCVLSFYKHADKKLDYKFEDYDFLSLDGKNYGSFLFVMHDGKPVGGVAQGTRWIDEAHRGKNLGAHLVLAALQDKENIYFCPVSYSVAGYKSRVEAHKIAVENAIKEGKNVPDNVLEEYRNGVHETRKNRFQKVVENKNINKI